MYSGNKEKSNILAVEKAKKLEALFWVQWNSNHVYKMWTFSCQTRRKIFGWDLPTTSTNTVC